jgi:hypothetical protein
MFLVRSDMRKCTEMFLLLTDTTTTTNNSVLLFIYKQKKTAKTIKRLPRL